MFSKSLVFCDTSTGSRQLQITLTPSGGRRRFFDNIYPHVPVATIPESGTSNLDLPRTLIGGLHAAPMQVSFQGTKTAMIGEQRSERVKMVGFQLENNANRIGNPGLTTKPEYRRSKSSGTVMKTKRMFSESCWTYFICVYRWTAHSTLMQTNFTYINILYKQQRYRLMFCSNRETVYLAMRYCHIGPQLSGCLILTIRCASGFSATIRRSCKYVNIVLLYYLFYRY